MAHPAAETPPGKNDYPDPDRRCYRCHRLGLGHRPGHVAHQVDYAITALDVGVEHLQGFIAGDDEVLLHLHLHVRASEQVAQAFAVAQELS